MFCSDARWLLDRGLIPNASEPERAALGFHLVGCTSCRNYRKESDELRLLGAMLAQPLRAPVAPGATAGRRHRAARPLRAAGAALVLGTALALVPCSGLMPATATAANAESALLATTYSRGAGTKQARPPAARSDTALLRDLLGKPTAPAALPAARPSDTALLRDLLDQPTTTARLRSEHAAQARIAAAELEAGQELTIPALSESAAPSSADIQAAPLQQTSQTYVVQPGDSLWAIAARFYGNGALWQTIYRANSTVIGSNPNLIYPNQRFTIPSAPAPLPVPQAPQTGRGPGTGLYTIVSGDTLSDIALWAYGDASRWPDLYARNAAAIGNNPHLIYPGTVLAL